ncbi:DNA packaging protein, partial [Enterobacter sp. 56-7]|uniref:terminase small subunit-like protein n=1 Tax=Enterobacter sp. 56-7 TaxID=1895906 RepID=UPI00095B2DBC
MSIGRPTLLTPPMADAICNRLIEGESLSSICRDKAMPAKSAVFRWIATDPSFKDRYTRAKIEGCTAMAEDAISIADDDTNDWNTSNDPQNPGWRPNGENIQRSRLRVETRKWMLSRLLPHL